MALRNQSLFLYGLAIDATNSSLDFKISGGPTLLATLRQGYYSLNSLMTEVIRAMGEQSPLDIFTYAIDRSVNDGTENRVTVAIASGTITFLFATGPRVVSSCALTLGFTATDQTGASLTSSSTAGTALITAREGYNYLSPDFTRKVKGAVNIAASGVKEAIVYEVQQFAQVEFRHEPEAKVIAQWRPLMEWMIQQRPLEFTPDYTVFSDVIEGTLERTSYDGSGLGYQLLEMLPEFPFYYKTGQLVFRKSLGPYAVLTP